MELGGYDTRIYLPDDYNPRKKYPVVVSLPGWVVSHDKQARVFPVQSHVTRLSFILVVPQSGSSFSTGWNLNQPTRGFNRVMAGLDEKRSNDSCPDRSLNASSMDLSRLIVGGHSAGARAAYMIAAEKPDPRPAGLLIYGGDGSGADLTGITSRYDRASAPTFLVHIHGDRDGLVGYQGGKKVWESYRSRVNGCSGQDESDPTRQYKIFEGTGCRQGTSFFSINGGGHEADLVRNGVLAAALDRLLEHAGN